MAVFDAAERMTGPRNHAISEGYDTVITSSRDGRAWHQLDQPFDHQITWQEAYMRVGAYHPHKVRLTLPGGQESEAFSVVRSDPKDPTKLIELGAGVKQNYTVYENQKLFELAAPFLENGQCYITSAGSLRKGKDLFICMKINKEFSFGEGDIAKPFILFRSSHDGERGNRLTVSGERSVCQNTIVSAEMDQGLTIRHTGDVAANMQKAADLIDVATQKFLATCEQYEFLRTVDVDQAELERYVVKVLSTQKIEEGLDQIIRDTELTPEEVEAKRAEFEKALFPRMKAQILENFETVPGSKGDNTLLGALSAVTYWTTHQRCSTEENRFRSTYFSGDSARINIKALRVAMEMAKV